MDSRWLAPFAFLLALASPLAPTADAATMSATNTIAVCQNAAGCGTTNLQMGSVLGGGFGPAISGATTLSNSYLNMQTAVGGSNYTITLPQSTDSVLPAESILTLVATNGAGPVYICVARGSVFDTASAAPLTSGICASGQGIVLTGGTTLRVVTETGYNYFATLANGSPCTNSARGICQPDGVTLSAARGIISAQLPIASSVLTGTTTITSANWTAYARHLTKVACPAAGCTITLPQSTSSVAPPNTAFIFQSIGPGIMTIAATASGLEGVLLTAAAGTYVDRSNQETDYIESDGNNNYLVSPSFNPNFLCYPYSLLSSGAGNKAYNPSFSAWFATGSTLTANSQYSPDCAQNGATLIEDTSTGNHWASWEAGFSVGASTQYTASIFCRSLTSDRNCVFMTETSTFGQLASIIVNPITGVVVSGPGGGAKDIITPYGPGLVKISLTWTSSGSTDTGVYLFAGNASGTSASYVGSGASGVALYGACLAQGAAC